MWKNMTKLYGFVGMEITTEYLKPIFGFVLKRCKSIQDAEDLSQENCR